jgi:hypothetical protein
MRFDYLGRVLTIKPRLTPTEKGKLPQTNSQSKQAIFSSSYDKNRPQAIPNRDNQKRDNPRINLPPIKCYRCNQEGQGSKPVNVVEREDEECREGTKLCSEECYEPNGEGEYEDDDGQAYVVRRLLLTPKADDETQQHKVFHAGA